MRREPTKCIAEDEEFFPIYVGSRVHVEPGVSRTLRIRVPDYRGEVLGLDEEGNLRIQDEQGGGVRLARDRSCKVIKPRGKRSSS